MVKSYELKSNGYGTIVCSTDSGWKSGRYDLQGNSHLKEADLILAEDTRTSGILLKHFEIKKPMQSHHKFNEHQMGKVLLIE